jgi:predicted nucleotidyltransferase
MIHTIDDIREQAIPIILDNAEDVRSVVLFGSYAKGEQGEDSDVDLFVDGRLRYHTNDIVDIEDMLTEALSLPVEVITRSALNSSVICNSLYDSIVQDGVLLYEP